MYVLRELQDPAGFNPVPFVFFGLVGLTYLLFFGLRSRRSRQMKRLAERRGFDVLERDLPADFQTMLSGLRPWETVRNAVAGFHGSDMLVAFDIEMPRGRSSYLLTVVARRCAHPLGALEIPAKGFALRRMGDWRAVMLSGGFGPSTISPQRIEQLWEALV
jgi:hypothetical protein